MPNYSNDPMISTTNQTTGTDAAVVGINKFMSHLPTNLRAAGPNGGPGVNGESNSGPGVRGISQGGNGGWFESHYGEGVRGVSNNPEHGGVVGVNNKNGIAVYAESANGTGIYAKGKVAGFFQGDVEVKGDIRLVQADCAEDFDIASSVDAGTVMVLGEEGALHESYQAYDKRVAGVISGAGTYKPGIILDKQESETNRLPIGLLGKVYCKVDAQTSAIEIGDLLTTSSTPGHAMKAIDPLQAFGSVIGKALRPLREGTGLIPILIALQ
jgi:hypothetical protein